MPDLQARELGISPALGMLLVVGVAALVLSGLLYNIWLSDDGSSEALAKTLQWFGWIGGTAVSVSLLMAGLTGRSAPAGVRAAFLLIGAYLVISTQTSGAGAVASLFSSLFSAFSGI